MKCCIIRTQVKTVEKEKINLCNHLPCETFLDKVDCRPTLSLAAHASNVVAQTAVPAHQHAHGAHLVLDLHADQGVDVGSPREHLDGGAGALDLARVAGPGDEEHDPQHVPSAVHGEDSRHPGTDPFEVLGRLDNPDEGHPARGDRPVGVPLHQMTDKWDVVGDAHAAGEEHHRAV